jgi:hypothetical protein
MSDETAKAREELTRLDNLIQNERNHETRREAHARLFTLAGGGVQ